MKRDHAIHAIAGASALLVWLIWDPFGRVLAGDVEALIENLLRDWTTDYDQAPYARGDLIQPLRLAVRFGPVPLLWVAVAGAVYRLTAGEEGDHPLSRLSGLKKAAVSAGTLLPFAAAAFPLGLGLSIWVAVELYWWIEWYGDMDPTMLWIHERAPWLLLPGVAVAGVASLVFALSESPDPVLKKKRRRSLLRRIVRLAAAVPLSALAAAGVLGLAHASRVSPAGSDVHRENCGRCHERSLPLYYVKAPKGWERTLDTHREMGAVDLSEEDRAALLGFLTSNRSFSDGATATTRCGSCHGSTWRRWDRRSAEDWNGILRRLGWWSPYYYRADVAAQLRRFVMDEGLVDDGGGLLDLSPEDAADLRNLVEVCGLCHSVSYEADRYRGGDPGELRRMIARMNDKLSLEARLAEEGLDDVARSYTRWMGDPERWDHLVPHDRPELGTGRALPPAAREGRY